MKKLLICAMFILFCNQYRLSAGNKENKDIMSKDEVEKFAFKILDISEKLNKYCKELEQAVKSASIGKSYEKIMAYQKSINISKEYRIHIGYIVDLLDIYLNAVDNNKTYIKNIIGRRVSACIRSIDNNKSYARAQIAKDYSENEPSYQMALINNMAELKEEI